MLFSSVSRFFSHAAQSGATLVTELLLLQVFPVRCIKRAAERRRPGTSVGSSFVRSHTPPIHPLTRPPFSAAVAASAAASTQYTFISSCAFKRNVRKLLGVCSATDNNETCSQPGSQSVSQSVRQPASHSASRFVGLSVLPGWFSPRKSLNIPVLDDVVLSAPESQPGVECYKRFSLT